LPLKGLITQTLKAMKSNITMKTILILALAFGIQFSTLIASNIGEAVTPSEPNSIVCPECLVLSPTVPMEAPFSEVAEFDVTMNLIPDVPMEAEFDNGIEVELAAISFAPSFPLQADFDDVVLPTDANRFSPVISLVAYFSDTL